MFRWSLYKSVKSAIGSCKILKKFSDSEFVKSVTSNNGGCPTEAHHRISWAEPFAPYRALVVSPKASKCIFPTRFGRPHRTHLRIPGTADFGVRALGLRHKCVRCVDPVQIRRVPETAQAGATESCWETGFDASDDEMQFAWRHPPINWGRSMKVGQLPFPTAGRFTAALKGSNQFGV